MSSVVTEIMIFQDDELEEPLQKLKMGKLRVYMCMYCVYICSSLLKYTTYTHTTVCAVLHTISGIYILLCACTNQTVIYLYSR